MKKKLYLILGSFLTLIICVGLFWGRQLKNAVMVSVISEEKQEDLLNELELSENLEFQLLFQGERVPYDAVNDTYYLPMVTDEKWLWGDCFALSAENLRLQWCDDPYWEMLEEAIAEGHEFSFFVFDDQLVRKGKIVFTGIPMMRLETQQFLGDYYYYSRVTVFDPFHNTGGLYEITDCFGYLEIRGRTSKAFPKKGWDLDLVKENGQPYKTALFGLREDDDWKLNSLYPDGTKVKEMVCMELWNSLAEDTESAYDKGTNMEYFEMLMDQEYLGLYGAMEQLDYKQFSLNKNEDVIYKSYAWPLERNPDRYAPEEEAFGHLIKAADRQITEELWQPLYEYVEAAGFAEEDGVGDLEVFYEYLKEHMDMDNFLNIELYIQTLYAFDNKYKNLYIAADRRDDGDYTLWKVPWDLNYTFGERFDVDANALTSYNLEWSQELMPQFMMSEALLESGNKEFIKLLNAKWQELQNGVLSVENIQHIAEKHMERLVSSGAFARDEKCWTEGPHNTSIEEMLEFHSCRLDFLDEHYQSFLNEN